MAASRMRWRAGLAFTLIELLVVVAIIALLISILLPSLARAKEQSRIVKCMANSRSIVGGGATYALENRDYPWAVGSPWVGYVGGSGGLGFTLWTEFVWGGAMPNATDQEWQDSDPRLPSGTAGVDVYEVPPKFRPMNRYLSSSITWNADSRRKLGLSTGQRRPVPTETPDFFKCPSDNHPFVPTVEEDNPPPENLTPVSTWQIWGNSYAINWYWPYYYYRVAPWRNHSMYQRNFLAIVGGYSDRPSLGKELLKNKDGRFSSEFALFYENNLNYALEGARPPGLSGGGGIWQSQPKRLEGWHRQMDRHVVGFLDGSSRYLTMDTRYVFGSGWSIWPNKPWRDGWEQYNDEAPRP